MHVCSHTHVCVCVFAFDVRCTAHRCHHENEHRKSLLCLHRDVTRKMLFLLYICVLSIFSLHAVATSNECWILCDRMGNVIKTATSIQSLLCNYTIQPTLCGRHRIISICFVCVHLNAITHFPISRLDVFN